jgi:hypothetical protein
VLDDESLGIAQDGSGDFGEKLEINQRTRRGAALPPDYASLIADWDTNGLLDTDACWVPEGFTIPKDFQSCPVPARSEITLIYEHEDESTMYRDEGVWTGTRMTAVLDEVRKIGNVRSDLKVVSYVTSQEEIESDVQIDAIQREIPPHSRSGGADSRVGHTPDRPLLAPC